MVAPSHRPVPRAAGVVALALLALVGGGGRALAAQAGPASAPAATPAVTRGVLVPVYRASDQAYAALLPEAGPVRAAINRAFDRATLRFFAGDLAATVRAIADVRAMLVAPGLDTTARHSPLGRFVVRVAPVAWVASGAGAARGDSGGTPAAAGRLTPTLAAWRRDDSLTVTIHPLGADTTRRDTLAVRLELVPAPGRGARGRVSRPLALPMADGAVRTVRFAPAELRALGPGRHLARLVADAPRADTSYGEPFTVVPRPLDEVRRQLERRLAALAPAPAPVLRMRDRFAERLALLDATPADDATAVRLGDPTVLVPQLEAELAALEAQRDPYANREGDHWHRLRGDRAALPVRIIATRAVATSAVPVPVLVALHGAGIDENGFPDGYGDGRLVRDAAARGMLVASPSTLALQRDPALLDTLIAQLTRDYRVDGSRIYLLGHSLGAGLATQLVQRRGHPFAAAVLLAGGGRIASAAGVPPLRFHGAALDPVIPAARVRQAAEAATAAGVAAEYVEVPDVGHTMLVTHVAPEVLDWLLAQRRDAGQPRGPGGTFPIPRSGAPMELGTPESFTAEHRSFEWELALQYEDGSLPASAFTEATLTVVAGWYAAHLPPDEARRRYAEHYQRNRRRLANRLGGAAVNADALAALDGVWEALLTRRLPAGP